MSQGKKPDGSIAIVDDDPELAELTSELVEEAGLVPVHLDIAGLGSVGEFVGAVREQADAAICDHRLSFQDWAAFDGATAVAMLSERRVPSLLVTNFVMDTDVSIRRWRHKIPVVLLRPDVNPDSIVSGLAYCAEEFQGRFSPDRQPYRTLVRIESLTKEAGEEVADAFIPGWDYGIAVRFPLSLLDASLVTNNMAGQRFFALVNLGAGDVSDIFLTDFEPAPPTDD
jgi:CheY-like chemotaxis protein